MEQSYDEAVKLSPKYYAGYERRAEVKKKLGDKKGYKRDMEKAAKALPTALSYLALGELAEAEGNTRKAMTYFEGAATANSAAGESASRGLARLDRQLNPQNHVQGDARLDQQGMVVVTLANTLETPVDRVVFTLVSGGRKSLGRYRVDGAIGAGERVSVGTGIGPMNSNKFRKQAITVSVDEARRVE